MRSKNYRKNARFDLFAMDCKAANWSNSKYFVTKIFEDNNNKKLWENNSHNKVVNKVSSTPATGYHDSAVFSTTVQLDKYCVTITVTDRLANIQQPGVSEEHNQSYLGARLPSLYYVIQISDIKIKW